MTSLNAFLPALSELVGVSQGVLYERQRSLVRLGLINSRPGRGPGSGVSLTAQNLAVLLIGYAGSASLADVERTAAVCAAAPFEHDQNFACPVTGKWFFIDIVTKALSQPDLASRIPRIEIDLNGNQILVTYFPRHPYRIPRHYELYIEEDSPPHKGVMKKSIVSDLDHISAALVKAQKDE